MRGVGPITPQKIAAMQPVNERAQETGIPTVPTDFFLALLRRLFFTGEKPSSLSSVLSSLYILFGFLYPRGH